MLLNYLMEKQDYSMTLHFTKLFDKEKDIYIT